MEAFGFALYVLSFTWPFLLAWAVYVFIRKLIRLSKEEPINGDG